MNLYLIEFNECTYDQYNAFVVSANSEEDVLSYLLATYPEREWYSPIDWQCGWTISQVGTAVEAYKEPTIILDSFNAG